MLSDRVGSGRVTGSKATGSVRTRVKNPDLVPSLLYTLQKWWLASLVCYVRVNKNWLKRTGKKEYWWLWGMRKSSLVSECTMVNKIKTCCHSWHQHFLLSPFVFVHKTLKGIYVSYRHNACLSFVTYLYALYYISSFQDLGVKICCVPLLWPLACSTIQAMILGEKD